MSKQSKKQGGERTEDSKEVGDPRHFVFFYGPHFVIAYVGSGCSVRSVVRVGAPLVICEVLFRSPQGAERSKCEKPCSLLNVLITKVTRFLLSAYEERHNTSYRRTVDLRLHTYQDSSETTARCQREKPKTVHTASNKQALHEKQLSCASQTFTQVSIKLFQSLF